MSDHQICSKDSTTCYAKIKLTESMTIKFFEVIRGNDAHVANYFIMSINHIILL